MTWLSLATCWILDLSGILSMSWMIEFMSVSKKLSFSKFTKSGRFELDGPWNLRLRWWSECFCWIEIFFLFVGQKKLMSIQPDKSYRTSKGENTLNEMHDHDFSYFPIVFYSSLWTWPTTIPHDSLLHFWVCYLYFPVGMKTILTKERTLGIFWVKAQSKSQATGTFGF